MVTLCSINVCVEQLQCELYGHQSIDGSLIVLMLPSNMTSSLNVSGRDIYSYLLSLNRLTDVIRKLLE